MSFPAEFLPASVPVAAKQGVTHYLPLPTEPNAPTLFKARVASGDGPYLWRAHVPNGNPAYVVKVFVGTADTTAPTGAQMVVPAAGNARPFAVFRSDQPFLIDGTDRDWNYFYLQWNGPADTTIFITRAWPPPPQVAQ